MATPTPAPVQAQAGGVATPTPDPIQAQAGGVATPTPDPVQAQAGDPPKFDVDDFVTRMRPKSMNRAWEYMGNRGDILIHPSTFKDLNYAERLGLRGLLKKLDGELGPITRPPPFQPGKVA